MKTKLLLFTLFAFNLMCSAQSGLGFGIDKILYFDTGTSILTKEHKKILELYCKGSKDEQWEQGLIGYSDTIGKPHYNDTLSIKRARAVRDYIQKLAPKAKLYTYIGQRDSLHLTLPPNEQRKVELMYGLICGTDMEGYKKENAYGIYVEGFLTAQNYANADKYYNYYRVNAYLSAWHMLAGKKNGIDANNNILKVVAIASVCVNEGWVSPAGYEVFVPITKNPENDIILYLNNAPYGQPEQWKKTDIKVSIKKGCYSFKIDRKLGCITFCLGKPTVPVLKNKLVKAGAYKVVYISTYKPYDFTNVTAGTKTTGLSYTAKINDTLMAFTIPAQLSARQMKFYGTHIEDRKSAEITIPLNKCIFTKDADGNEHYYICKECVAEKTVARKKGFWAWVRRTLGVS